MTNNKTNSSVETNTSKHIEQIVSKMNETIKQRKQREKLEKIKKALNIGAAICLTAIVLYIVICIGNVNSYNNGEGGTKASWNIFYQMAK